MLRMSASMGWQAVVVSVRTRPACGGTLGSARLTVQYTSVYIRGSPARALPQTLRGLIASQRWRCAGCRHRRREYQARGRLEASTGAARFGGRCGRDASRGTVAGAHAPVSGHPAQGANACALASPAVLLGSALGRPVPFLTSSAHKSCSCCQSRWSATMLCSTWAQACQCWLCSGFTLHVTSAACVPATAVVSHQTP